MLAGHYGAAYALKAYRPEVPLWALFLAVQAVDVVFFALATAGVETLSVRTDVVGPLAMDLVHIPYTHSLVATLAYGAVLAGIGALLGKGRSGVVIAAALVSHWVLDLPVHLSDLPMTLSGDSVRVGLGLWKMPMVGLGLELAVLLGGFLYFRGTIGSARARTLATSTCAGMAVVQVIYAFFPPPGGSVASMAAAAEAMYLVACGLAAYFDHTVRTQTSRT